MGEPSGDGCRCRELEKMGYIDVGRTLPSDYLYFSGNGKYNTYRTEYIGGAEYVPEDGI